MFFLFGFGLFFCGRDFAVAASRSADEGTTRISGTIQLNGCQINPRTITLVAKPITAVGISDSRESRGSRRIRSRTRVRQVRARFRISALSRQIPFSIREVAKGTVYKLYVGLPEQACGKVFWRGPADGLVPGGTREVKIEGFAARTEVELFDRNLDEWVGADHLDFTDEAASVRTLRWRSSLPAVQSAELQVSVEPFPISGNFGSCDEVEGAVVYRRTLPVAERGEWQIVPDINFKSFLVPGRTGGSSAVDQRTFQRIVAGAPIYIRIVPSANGISACDVLNDGVHGWVIVAKLPGINTLEPPPSTPASEIEAGSGQMYIPPRIDGGASAGHPTYGEIAYKVIKPHLLPPKKCFSGVMTKKQFNYYFYGDPLGCLLVNSNAVKPGTILAAGRWFWFTPQKSSSGSSNPLVSWGNSLVSLGTAFYGALGEGVNALHQLAQEVENTITNIITDIITAVDFLDACTALKNAGLSCKTLVKAGLKVGMTSLGVPPVSIPNWEQIQSQGFDYVAGAMATEIANATGVPAELTQDKLKELVETATKKAFDEITKERHGSAVGYDWVIPYNGFDPAIWSMKLKSNSVDGLPTNMRLIRKDSSLFLGGNIGVPHFFPETNEMRIPAVLPMNVSSIPAPICQTNRFLQTTCSPAPHLTVPKCMVELNDVKGVYHWVEWDCQYFTAPGRYYRDRWIDALHSTSSCATLWSTLFTAAGGLYLPFPIPQLVEFASVKPEQWFTWNGPVYFAPGCP